MADDIPPAAASLRACFNREVQKATNDFPQLEGRFIFINVPEEQTIISADPLKTPLTTPEQFNFIAAQIAGSAKESGTSLATKVREANLDVLAFMPLPYKIFAGRDQSDEMEAVAEFNHELGHLVVAGAFSSPGKTQRETAADVFAALRHIQRYGDDSRAIEKAGWHRAFDFVMSGDADHFTTFGLDAISGKKDGPGIAAMTPQQTAELAEAIALGHTPSAETITRLTAAFAPAREIMQRTRDVEACLKEIASISLGSADHDTFKIGSRALKPFLSGDVSTIRLAGDYWDDIRAQIKSRHTLNGSTSKNGMTRNPGRPD